MVVALTARVGHTFSPGYSAYRADDKGQDLTCDLYWWFEKERAKVLFALQGGLLQLFTVSQR
jgi:hypothetical protein